MTGPPRTQPRGGGPGLMKSRMSRLTLTGSRVWGKWPEPSRTVSAPFASSASRARRPGPYGVVAPVDHEDWTVDPREERAYALLVQEPWCQLSRNQRLGVRLEAPADCVLALLGRVRLREALREEELEELLVVLDPVVTIPLSPADVVVKRLAELLHRLKARGSRWQR